jgi:hypothetical protein
VEKWGEERVMTGDYPGDARRHNSALTVEPLQSDDATMELVEQNQAASADPAAIRPALARLAAANLDGLERALLDAALSATTTRWATVTCDGCGARSRVELPVPDVRSRLQAIETLLAQGLGRPGQSDEPSMPRMPKTVSAVKEMGWEEMQHVFAAVFMDEIAAVKREGGGALVRQKVAALSDGERRVLRDALLESPA